MSTVTGGQGNIVTNGLVLNLDAANPRSYPQPYNGTVWADLSGNGNNGTLINGPTFNTGNGGSIVFDGTNAHVTTTFNTQLTNFTVCLWFRPTDSTNPNLARLLDKNYAGGFWLGKGTSANSWGGGVLEGGSPFGRYLTLTDGQWNFLASTRSGTTHTLYGNGISNTTSGTVSSNTLDTTNLMIARFVGGGGYNFKGNIPQTSIYNRALSSQEVLQNFNATRARFGV